VVIGVTSRTPLEALSRVVRKAEMSGELRTRLLSTSARRSPVSMRMVMALTRVDGERPSAD